MAPSADEQEQDRTGKRKDHSHLPGEVCVCVCACVCVCYLYVCYLVLVCVLLVCCMCYLYVVCCMLVSPPSPLQHEPILDITRYHELQEVLFSAERLTYLDIMANIFRHHHADLARVLVHVYGSNGCHEIVPLIIEASSKVVTKEGICLHPPSNTCTHTCMCAHNCIP